MLVEGRPDCGLTDSENSSQCHYSNPARASSRCRNALARRDAELQPAYQPSAVAQGEPPTLPEFYPPHPPPFHGALHSEI